MSTNPSLLKRPRQIREADCSVSQRRIQNMLIVALLVSLVGVAAASQTSVLNSQNTAVATVAAATKPAVSTKKPSRYRAAGLPASAAREYELRWGVDQLTVSLAESGQLVRFSYRVTDISRAAVVHDRAATPYLLDEKVHAVLQVPVMEKVGPLRQSVAPEHGKSYWMVFSNKGNIVKAGHRVSVVIGQFRVDGLVVQK